MGRGLRSLERSVVGACNSSRSHFRNNLPNTVHKQRPAEGFNSLGELQEQIAVVRGQYIAPPTDSLRALEQRVLGVSTARSVMLSGAPERETLRLDQGQVAPGFFPAVQVPTLYPAYTQTPWNDSVGLIDTGATSQAYSVPAYAAANYAPEFSAPGSGRFQVESFADEDYFIAPDLNGAQAPLIQTPALPSQSPAIPSFQAPTLEAPQVPAFQPPSLAIGSQGGGAGQPMIDDSDWISAAQNERPAKITAASKQSLNPSLALAKHDFERELAEILGTSAASAPAPSVASTPDSLFNTSAADPKTSIAQQPSGAPNKPAAPTEAVIPHPNHNVFDQMGLAMRYANSFDLGNVSLKALKDRFDHFEEAIDVGAHSSQPAQPARAQGLQNPFVDPMSLDDFDLVAELAEIGVERPVAERPVVEPTLAPPPVMAQPDNTVPQHTTAAPGLDHIDHDPKIGPTAPITAPIAPKPTMTPESIIRTETTAGDSHE